MAHRHDPSHPARFNLFNVPLGLHTTSRKNSHDHYLEFVLNTHRWTSSIVALTALCWVLGSSPVYAQRPTRVWNQPEQDSDIARQRNVVFQGRLTMLKRFFATEDPAVSEERNHLWLTDGTTAGSELVFADAVMSDPVVHDGLLYFVGLGGPSFATLYTFDGKDVTAVASLDADRENFRLNIQGNLLFVDSSPSLYAYNLTTQTLETISSDHRGYRTDGILIALSNRNEEYAVRRLNAPDEGVVVSGQNGIWLHNGLVYTGGEQLHISDGTQAGTRTVAIPDFSAVTEINEIYGVAGNQLLLGAAVSIDNTDPTGRTFLAACDLNGDNIRVVNPSAPILINHFTPYLPDPNGSGHFLQDRDGNIHYSDGSSNGTQLVFPAPPRASHFLTQIYDHQNTNLLVYQESEGLVPNGAVYSAQGGDRNPNPLFQESDRFIYSIDGPIGDQLLVTYAQKRDAQPAIVQLGFLNPTNGTLVPIENHEEFTSVGLPLSNLVHAGNTVAVRQNALHAYDSAWAVFFNKRTGLSQRIDFPGAITFAEHNGTIYLAQYYNSSYTIETWNEDTAALEPLITRSAAHDHNLHLKVAQNGTRTGVWYGGYYKVFDSATLMTTNLITDIFGSHLSDVDGHQLFADRDNVYIVNPELTAVQTVALAGSFFYRTAGDSEFGYIGWYDSTAQVTQLARVDATGTVAQFSLARPEQQLYKMVSLSPQRVLVIDYNADAGVATLLAVNSDTETVTPLHSFSSRGVETNTFALVRAGNRAYFTTFDETHGDELWATDGTPAGTQMVADLYPGTRGSFPSFLKADGDALTFRATGADNQSRHWRLAPGENTPVAMDEPALANRVGLRLLGGDGDQQWYTSTERDLWWFHPQFPLTFDAPDSVCNNGETFTIHADAVHPETQFEWTPVNADLVEGQGGDTVTLRADGNGDVQVNVAVILGDSTRNETLTLPLRTVTPDMPTLISGPVQPCALEENVRYTTPAVANAVGYEWSVPAGAVIVRGQGTAQVAVTFGDQPGDVRVRAINACGASDWRGIAITLMTDGIVANAGEDRVTCNAAYTLNAELPVDAIGQWTVLDGDVTLSDITDPNAVLTFAGTGDATLSWRIKKGICPSAADTVTISYYEGFTLANAGDDIRVCNGLTTTLNGNRPEWSTVGRWTVVSGEGGHFSTPTYSRATFYGRPNEPYVLRWSLTGTPCTESDDTVSVIFYGADSIAAPTHQTISLGESIQLEPTTQGAPGYWEILFGPNRNLSQLTEVDSAATRFTPTQEGEYHLRWNFDLPACDAVRVTTVVTVTNEVPFTSRVAQFARPAGTPTDRNYFRARTSADRLLIGAGSGNQPQSLVTPNGSALDAVFAGDACTTAFNAPGGGTYVVTTGGAWAVNLYHRAANADTFTFLAGTDANPVGACSAGATEQGITHNGHFFFTLGQSLFAFDLSQARLDWKLDLEKPETDLLVWEGDLYAAGTGLWRYQAETDSFVFEWYNLRLAMQTPIIQTNRGLFWSAYDREAPEQAPGGLFFFDNHPFLGPTMVVQDTVSGLAAVNDEVLFHHTTSGRGSEPWLSDGSEAGTRLLADLDAGPASNAPAHVQAFSHAGAAFFYRDGHLWRYQGGAEAPTRFVALSELRTYQTEGDNLLLWDGHRMRRTPANTPAAQVSVVYELDFQDQAEIDMLGVWQNRLYLQRRENNSALVLAVPLDGGAVVALNQDYRLPEAATTYVGNWDDRLLLLDSATSFTLKRYDGNGNITPLLTFPEDPHPVVSYQFNSSVFFIAGADRTLYRSNGTFSGTSALGSPALRQVQGVTKTNNGILFFAEDGSGERHAYFCGVIGGPQLLGTGIQPAQPRSDAVSGRFHTLADSAASLFFLENSNGSITMWRWMDNEGTVVRSNQFDNDPQRAVVAVADAQPTYCVFQISNTLYHYNGANQRVTILTDSDPTYQGTFDGTPLFTLAGQIGWVDRAGAWHQATPPSPIDGVRGKIAGYVLVHTTGAGANTHRWYALGHNRFEGTATLPDNFAQVATLPGFLVFTTEQGIGVADRQSTAPEILNPESYADQTEKPLAVTERALYYAHQPDSMSRFKGYRFSDSGEYDAADYLGQEVFAEAGAPAADYIRWVRRLGDGLVVCIEMPGMGQALWHLTNFAKTRVDTAPSPQPNYVVWAAEESRIVVADLSRADGITLLEIHATSRMFTDPVLADHLLAGYDENGDGGLDAQERATVTDLDLSGLGLQSLDGIDLLPNLRALDLSDNLITDLGPLLDHPSLGNDSGDFLDVSLNPLAEQHCIQIETLKDRAFTEGDNLILSPNKVRGNPSYDTWPQNSILQLLRPGFTANPQPWSCNAR